MLAAEVEVTDVTLCVGFLDLNSSVTDNQLVSCNGLLCKLLGLGNPVDIVRVTGQFCNVVALASRSDCLQATGQVSEGCVPVDGDFVGGIAAAVVIVGFGDGLDINVILGTIRSGVVGTAYEHAGNWIVDFIGLARTVVGILCGVDTVTGEVRNVHGVSA